MRSPSEPGSVLDLPPGTKVWVEWRGTWWKATIVHPLGAGRHRIHYDGWGASTDENVAGARIAPRERPPPGTRARSASPRAVAIVFGIAALVAAYLVATNDVPVARPGLAISSVQALHPNDPVWVYWNRQWFEAIVLYTQGADMAHVHYEGWDDSYDEDVTLDRVRTRR
jgi:hypothetical protein